MMTSYRPLHMGYIVNSVLKRSCYKFAGVLFPKVSISRSMMRTIQELPKTYLKLRKIIQSKSDHSFRQFADLQQRYRIHITLLLELKKI